MSSAKYDSDATSQAASSPPRSPKRQVYYVQSPSRDSHDGDKSSSMQPSPMESPSHPSFGRHSRNSSASRFSGIFRSSSGRKSSRKRSAEKGWNDKGWPECNAILEEGEYEDVNDKNFTRRLQAFIALLVFVLLFTVFCLILWGASRSYKPQIVVKNFNMHYFLVGEGSDDSGVPTKMMTINGTLNMSIYNPASTFGIHVTSSPIDILYTEIAVATGQLRKHYQPRKSRRIVSADVLGKKFPLYGAGSTLVVAQTSYMIPLVLKFQIKSRGYIVGKLVRTTHRKAITCNLLVNSTSYDTIKFKKDDCTYEG